MNARTWGCSAAVIVVGALGVVVIGMPLRWYLTTTAAVARIEAAGGTVGSPGALLAPARYVTFSSAPGGGRLNDTALAQLLPYLEDVQVLDLSGTAITDAALSGLLGLPQLVALELGLTAVTGVR